MNLSHELEAFIRAGKVTTLPGSFPKVARGERVVGVVSGRVRLVVSFRDLLIGRLRDYDACLTDPLCRRDSSRTAKWRREAEELRHAIADLDAEIQEAIYRETLGVARGMELAIRKDWAIARLDERPLDPYAGRADHILCFGAN